MRTRVVDLPRSKPQGLLHCPKCKSYNLVAIPTLPRGDIINDLRQRPPSFVHQCTVCKRTLYENYNEFFTAVMVVDPIKDPTHHYECNFGLCKRSPVIRLEGVIARDPSFRRRPTGVFGSMIDVPLEAIKHSLYANLERELLDALKDGKERYVRLRVTSGMDVHAADPYTDGSDHAVAPPQVVWKRCYLIVPWVPVVYEYEDETSAPPLPPKLGVKP